MANKPNKKKDTEKPKVHKDLEGLDIRVNELGEIESNYDLDKVNEFLNKNVDDKKLRDRDDIIAPKNIEDDDNDDL